MARVILHCLVVSFLVVSSVALLPAQPSITAVVNAASYDPAVPRGCIIAIFGTKLARTTAGASSLPLPRKIEDAAVLVGNLELQAPLYFVSPTQINAQLPFEALGDTLSLIVTTAEGRSQPFSLKVAPAGPGLFTRDASGRGPVLAFTPAFQPADTVAPGDTVILYAAGLGPTDPPVLSGSPGAAQEPFNRVVNVPEVYAGDYPLPAQVSFAGLAPGLAGVYQLNVTPQWLGTDRLYLRSGGKRSNIVQLPLKAGQNVTNAGGSIQVLYPAAGEPVGWTPHLLVVRITARMDIGAAAGPFAIVAVGEGDAGLTIAVDPANGAFEGLVSVPTLRSRQFDFSGSTEVRWDLFTCQPSGPGGTPFAQPFPGNIIPVSRVSPKEVQALNLLPLPTTEIAGSATGVFRVQGQVRRSATFVIDESNNSAVSVFAAYIPVQSLCARDQATTVKLYIDGKQVASTELHYTAGGFPFPGSQP